MATAWPFDVAPPDSLIGPAEVPTSPTVITASDVVVLGGQFVNPTGGDITLEVLDGAGEYWFGPITYGPGTPESFEGLRPASGLTWLASAPGLIGHLWGYEA